ncbi:MAG TPA: glycosidase [Candidatus Pacearchaeota archaeon]|nr:glycosidase [Candidatus Pacearchaeota archaeon]
MKVERLGVILKPIKEHKWESLAVFNPGASYDGKYVHLIYRAIGKGNISVFGYAKSRDGINFRRMKKPLLVPKPKPKFRPRHRYEFKGYEDARITKIDETYYITYVHTMPEWWGARTCLCSTRDFKNFKFYGIILPEIDDKDVVLFPEKIKDKFVLFHRIKPSIWIAYSDNLKHWKGHQIVMTPRKTKWDCAYIGPAAPPLKTNKGWLLFYHGVDFDKVYRVGFAVFDLENPSKLLYRSDEPLMEPESYEELWGVTPSVVYPCGVIEKDGYYYIYYGSADTVVSAARIKVKDLLDSIPVSPKDL